MPRFFMPEADLSGAKIRITGRDAEHIRVLRLRIGEELTVCDGRGTDYKCRLAFAGRDEAEAEVLEVVPCRAEPTVFTKVLCGLPKGDKTDYILQKCTEAGASEIGFFFSERCAVRPDAAGKKLERWQRIAEEAAKQSGRGIVPEVRWYPTYDSALDAAAETELALFMYENGERESLKAALCSGKTARTAAVITGPEGGFAPCETEKAKERGFHICSMGERILRCETAPLVALTALMYESGNLE